MFDRIRTDELKVEQAFVRTPLPASLSAETEAALEQVIRKIKDCPVTTEPFPFVVIDEIFPPAYYARMQEMFPRDAELTPLSDTGRTANAYKERLVSLFNDEHFDKLDPERRAFWAEFARWMYSERFINSVVQKFLPWCANRLAQVKERSGDLRVRSDALLVSDRTDYAIGPHTDAAHRLITFLFYMPQDDRYRAYGTSLFR
ncbi:MAG: hypothetical protein ACK54L_14205, partial [Betaproteobacteria bacterium]